MKYSRVYIDSIGYELPPVVVTTSDLEDRLSPLYSALRIPSGQIEHLVPQRLSLMPELLLRDMTAQQVADLLAYLSSLK